MCEPRRQHPVAALTQLLGLLRQNLVTLLVLFFVGSGSESDFFFYGILAALLIFVLLGVAGWWRFSYRVCEGELRIEQGIFVRKKLFLNRERIQVIDISAGVVQRLFNLVSVEVKTAGSTSKEAKIEAVTRGEARRLRQALRPRPAGAGQQEEAGEERPEDNQGRTYQLSFGDLLVTASTSGNLGIALSVVGGVYSQVDQVVDEQQMIRFVQWLIPATAGVGIVLSTILVLLVVSWVLSVGGTLIKYYGFTLQVREQELHIRRGLFEQKQLTIPFNRIQAIQVREELLRQPLGYASVVLESAGYGEQQLNSTTLFPLLKRGETRRFLAEVIPEYAVAVKPEHPPRIALRRYLLRMLWMTLPVIVPAWLWLPYGAYALLLLVPALLLGYAQYRDAGIGIADDHSLVLRSRLLSRTTAIVKRYRVQAAASSQNPFQRRLGLSSWKVTVTSGSSGQTFGIRDLGQDQVRHYLQWVSGRGREPKPGAPAAETD